MAVARGSVPRGLRCIYTHMCRIGSNSKCQKFLNQARAKTHWYSLSSKPLLPGSMYLGGANILMKRKLNSPGIMLALVQHPQYSTASVQGLPVPNYASPCTKACISRLRSRFCPVLNFPKVCQQKNDFGSARQTCCNDAGCLTCWIEKVACSASEFSGTSVAPIAYSHPRRMTGPQGR